MTNYTPLERIVGFKVSEQIYDHLSWRDQVIIDLLVAGWNQAQVAEALDVSPSTITLQLKRIRTELANSKLRGIFEP